MKIQRVKLVTEDNVEIIGNYFPSKIKNSPAVVLLHMMPAAKESWNDLAEKLKMAEFHCLAIDLRGHGESQGGPDGFKNFSDEDHQSSINDVKAAVNFFTNQDIPLKRISLVGASIGANLCLQFQVEHPEIKAVVLLSPGLDYKGIATERLAKQLKGDQAFFMAAGGENDAYSSETVSKLFALSKNQDNRMKILKNAGHGTTMFKEEPALMGEIVEWLKKLY
ncbi:alpha/beta fold hydrolase [Candidatus Parcubacteria bacterium]|nr:MAG: alpha/beta fold hydrolase [Candidatus Parcubacteria bacterium]